MWDFLASSWDSIILPAVTFVIGWVGKSIKEKAKEEK